MVHGIILIVCLTKSGFKNFGSNRKFAIRQSQLQSTKHVECLFETKTIDVVMWITR